MSLFPFKFKSVSFCFQIPDSSLVINNHSGTHCLLGGHWYAAGIGLSCRALGHHHLSLPPAAPFSSLLSSIHSEFIFCSYSVSQCLFSLAFFTDWKTNVQFSSPQGSIISNPSCHFALALFTPRLGEEVWIGVRGEAHIRNGFTQICQCTWKNYTAEWLERRYQNQKLAFKSRLCCL